MAKKLSEMMAERRQRKEIARAAKIEVINASSGEKIVGYLRSLTRKTGELDLNLALNSAKALSGKTVVFDQLMANPKNAAMYKLAESTLDSDWLPNFVRLLETVPVQKRANLTFLSWEQWKTYGEAAGFDEAGTISALKTMAVFATRQKKGIRNLTFDDGSEAANVQEASSELMQTGAAA